MDVPTTLYHHHHHHHPNINHPDSAESSPRSRPGESWDEPLPLVPGGKLRLMCSYGGHIVPRPHDKSLCYVGGDTRMVVVDRNSSLSTFSLRLSRTLIGGRPFTLKYQLPNEDLDSLISVTTDEDLENMIEENDRINSVSLTKPGRLRLFLFPTKPETAISMGSLLDDAKSETWFVDALNNAALSRGESDSAAMDCLLEIDDRSQDIGNQNVPPLGNNNKQVADKISHQDVQSITTDAPVAETTSSFDSSSSAPSVAYLKPIKVRIDQDQMMVGLDDQLSNLNLQKQEEELVLLSAPTPTPTPPIPTIAPVSNYYTIRDNERLPDHRKPPLPLQLVQKKKGLTSDVHHNLPSPDSNPSGVFNLPSPDSVASDSSVTSATSFSKQQHATNNGESSTPPPHINPTNANEPNQSNHIEPTSQQMVQTIIQDPRHRQQQPQFIQQTPTHYIDHHGHHHPIMSLPSYYAMQPNNKQSPVHLQNQVYFLQPFNQNQPYTTYPISDTSSPNPSITVPPVYQTKQELSPSVYITPTTLLQAPTGQYQQQYVGLPQKGQNYYLSQSVTASSASGANNYHGFDQYTAHSGHDDQQAAAAYHSPNMFTSQYQTINPATAMLLPQANSAQVPTNSDNKIP